MLVIDQRRIEKGRMEGICCDSCCIGTSKVEDDSSYGSAPGDKAEDDNEVASTKIGQTLTPILTHRIGKLAVPVVFTAWAVFNVFMMLRNGTGLTVTDVVPDDSYVSTLIGTSDKYWEGDTYRIWQVVFTEDFYADEAKVQDM